MTKSSAYLTILSLTNANVLSGFFKDIPRPPEEEKSLVEKITQLQGLFAHQKLDLAEIVDLMADALLEKKKAKMLGIKLHGSRKGQRKQSQAKQSQAKQSQAKQSQAKQSQAKQTQDKKDREQTEFSRTLTKF